MADHDQAATSPSKRRHRYDQPSSDGLPHTEVAGKPSRPRTGSCCYRESSHNSDSSRKKVVRCNRPAKWWIQEQGAKYDDYTESCTEHVAEFLCEDTIYIIAPAK